MLKQDFIRQIKYIASDWQKQALIVTSFVWEFVELESRR